MNEPQKCDDCGKPKDHPIHHSERWNGPGPTHCFTVNTKGVPRYTFGDVQGVMKDATHFSMGVAEKDYVDVTFDYYDTRDGKRYYVEARGTRKEVPGDPGDGDKTA